MNKEEMVAAIAEETGLSKTEVSKLLKTFIEVVIKSLKTKKEVRLVNFGTFYVAKNAARMGVHPQTGKKIKIPASFKAKFRAGKRLIEAVNN